MLGTRRLVELVGWDRARPLASEGLTLDAQGAVEAGLATEVFDGDAGDWVGVRCNEPVADRETLAAIRAACRQDRRDEDLLSLDGSASRPGLKGRIARYVQSLRK